ncbi:hypothetical protein [Chryseobacterium gambrini]|uniref:hypothetical protein n=1 Tax=Chryseobacterium gambrini TaxID=373672 RepID=UPI0022F384F2|nr:hypothetical protein [Chryseobacterium gambrini]WBX97251.1 hypothetical protein PE065_20765 [Chryseobacterium gambrini]
MKILFFTLNFLAIVSCKKESTGNIQNNSGTDNATINKVSEKSNDTITSIEDIKKEYATVNNLLSAKQLDSTKFTYNCDEKEGEVILYYENKDLRMIKDSYAEHSHFSSSTKYYVKNNSVFFIFKEETVWNFDEGGTPEKPETKDDINEKRIYVLNNKAIQCLEKNYTIRSKGNNRNPDSIPNKETKCDIAELMKNYNLILKNKDRKGEINCL